MSRSSGAPAAFSSVPIARPIRLAYLQSWLRFYEPYVTRAASAARVEDAAARAVAIDPGNAAANGARLFVIPPFGRFIEAEAALRAVQQTSGAGSQYTGWFMRTLGHVRDSLVEDERAYRSDPLNPMSANLVALARMAAGRVNARGFATFPWSRSDTERRQAAAGRQCNAQRETRAGERIRLQPRGGCGCSWRQRGIGDPGSRCRVVAVSGSRHCAQWAWDRFPSKYA